MNYSYLIVVLKLKDSLIITSSQLWLSHPFVIFLVYEFVEHNFQHHVVLCSILEAEFAALNKTEKNPRVFQLYSI